MLGALLHVECVCACVYTSKLDTTTAARILVAICWCFVFCLVLALRAATTAPRPRRQLLQEEDPTNVTATTEPVTACKEPPGLMSPHVTHMESRVDEIQLKLLKPTTIFCVERRCAGGATDHYTGPHNVCSEPLQGLCAALPPSSHAHNCPHRSRVYNRLTFFFPVNMNVSSAFCTEVSTLADSKAFNCDADKQFPMIMLALQAGMERDMGAQRDRQIRLHSVHTDLELDLPPSIPLPDGEEIPYGSSTRLHIRDSEQESEIYQKCIRAPPNRTVFDGESPPPYRSSSAGLLSLGSTSSSSSTDWTHNVVRCHSMSSRYPPPPHLPAVIVPTRQRLSGSTTPLGRLTMVPCLADPTVTTASNTQSPPSFRHAPV